MSKRILVSFMITVMSLNSMKNDKKENISPQALVKFVKTQHNSSDEMAQFAEGIFEYMQKTKPAMYKQLVGGLYSEYITNNGSAMNIQGK